MRENDKLGMKEYNELVRSKDIHSITFMQENGLTAC